MPNHDHKRPFARAGKLKPAESAPIDPGMPEKDTCEQDMSLLPTRWQRMKEHPAFKPALAVGGLLAVGGVTLLTLRSPEGIKPVSTAVLEKVPEFIGAAFEGIGETTSSRSPIEHMVNGYSRLQHYGPGSTETKIVQISSYLRGGSS